MMYHTAENRISNVSQTLNSRKNKTVKEYVFGSNKLYNEKASLINGNLYILPNNFKIFQSKIKHKLTLHL